MRAEEQDKYHPRIQEISDYVSLWLHTRSKEIISPVMLTGKFPEYANFQPWSSNELIYLRNGRVLTPAKKAVVAFMGPSASGKDSIRNEVEKLWPNGLTKIKTATTRIIDGKARKETGDSYTFCSESEFSEMKRQGKFIETVHQGSHHYGTPTSSLENAIAEPEPVKLWLGELIGAEHLRAWMAQHHPDVPFISVFVLPNMTLDDYLKRIFQKRGASQAFWRATKAVWELSNAPRSVDAFVLNPFDVSGAPIKASFAVKQFFDSFITK